MAVVFFGETMSAVCVCNDSFSPEAGVGQPNLLCVKFPQMKLTLWRSTRLQTHQALIISADCRISFRAQAETKALL